MRGRDLPPLLRHGLYVGPRVWRDHDGEPKTGLARLDVHLRDGSVRHAATTGVRGSPTHPLSVDALEAKFLSCARAAVGEPRAGELLALIQGFPELSTLGPLSRLLAHARSAGQPDMDPVGAFPHQKVGSRDEI